MMLMQLSEYLTEKILFGRTYYQIRLGMRSLLEDFLKQFQYIVLLRENGVHEEGWNRVARFILCDIVFRDAKVVGCSI